MLVGMIFSLVTDKEMHEGSPYYISPGGYEINGIGFDFFNSEIYYDYDEPHVVHYKAYGLMTEEFPESKNITMDDFKKGKFTEFFIYTGEDGDPEIHILEVKDLSVIFDNEDAEFSNDTELVESANECIKQLG